MTRVVVAPFSNSDIRDWPLDHYAEFIGLLLGELPEETTVHVIGAPNQRLRVCEVVRAHPSTRVINECGRRSWPEVLAMLQGAACIISNNSGIGHLGGHFGIPTVCVFGGSHQRHEWRPLGRTVITVSRQIGCSPCQLDHGGISPYGKACLREITPRVVADAALRVMRLALPVARPSAPDQQMRGSAGPTSPNGGSAAADMRLRSCDASA